MRKRSDDPSETKCRIAGRTLIYFAARAYLGHDWKLHSTMKSQFHRSFAALTALALLNLTSLFFAKTGAVETILIMWSTTHQSLRTIPESFFAIDLWKLFSWEKEASPSGREMRPAQLEELFCTSKSLFSTSFFEEANRWRSSVRSVQNPFFKSSSTPPCKIEFLRGRLLLWSWEA